MSVKINNNAKKFLLALALCLIAFPFARALSPRAIIDGNELYLAWLPLSVMNAAILLFGRHAVAPLILALAVTNGWQLRLPYPQALIMLFSQLTGVFAACGLMRALVGKNWRYGIPHKHLGARILWTGFMAPLFMKGCMYLTGEFIVFPQPAATFFDFVSVDYTIIDLQSLICAGLIFTLLFYYPLRMLQNPHYVRIFWRKYVRPYLQPHNALFTFNWFIGLALALAVLCVPFESNIIAGYLVPAVFLLFFMAIDRLSYPVINLAWAMSVFLLIAYNKNFLQGVETGNSLSFVLSVVISFTIAVKYMTKMYTSNEMIKRKWQSQAYQDPLTNLPNLRALENYLSDSGAVSVCCLHMGNLELLNRHYGMMLGVRCRRMISRTLQPLLAKDEQLFQLPESELLLVLTGPETLPRLTHIVNLLNNRKIGWHNEMLELEFGASWGIFNAGDDLHHILGQLSWLAEQACAAGRVLALNGGQAELSDQTSERVLLLNRVKRALEGGGLTLYAQPIYNAAGDGYYEILSRLVCDGETIMPDRFIPIVTQFNLSQRFDMRVVETLFMSLRFYPGRHFSVNLLPFTLMQKESAAQIIALFARYGVSPQVVTIEITEEQAFSNSEVSMQNIRQLREFGCLIAIDDFGTGYANYERLKRLEADIVKIDGCFVRDIVSDPTDAIIIKSIVELARVKKMTLVAEYVETEEQRELLLQLGVDYLQGYLIGKPKPLDELR